MTKSDLPDWTITEDEDGTRHAVGIGVASLTVLPEGESLLFKRNGVKRFGSGHAEYQRWLVAELDGVRVYYDGRSLILTKRDLYP